MAVQKGKGGEGGLVGLNAELRACIQMLFYAIGKRKEAII